MSLRTFSILGILILLFQLCNAQEMSIGTDTPNPNAILELQTNNKGVLIPRLTTAQRTSMTSGLGAAELGLLIFNTTSGEFNYWNGVAWISFPSAAADEDWYEEGTSTSPNDINDNIYTNGSVGIGVPVPERELHVDGAIRVDGNAIYNNEAASGPNLNLISTGGVSVILDANTNGSEQFSVKSGTTTSQNAFEITEGGNTQMDGDLTVSGNDLEFDGATNPVDIYTNSSNASMGLDIESQGGIDIVLDRDNTNASSDFTIKRNGDGTAAVNTLMTVPEDFSPLVYPYGTASGETGGIRFRESASNGTSYVGIRAPDALSGSIQFTLPNLPGSAGDVLTTDGLGNLSWTDPVTRVAFMAKSSANITSFSTGVEFNLLMNLPVFNYGGGTYNTGTGFYTVPETGVYAVYTHLAFLLNSTNDDLVVISRTKINGANTLQTGKQIEALYSTSWQQDYDAVHHVYVTVGQTINVGALCIWDGLTPAPIISNNGSIAPSTITIVKVY